MKPTAGMALHSTPPCDGAHGAHRGTEAKAPWAAQFAPAGAVHSHGTATLAMGPGASFGFSLFPRTLHQQSYEPHRPALVHATLAGAVTVCTLLRAALPQIILHQTIDSVLKRGEKLDTLVEKSNDLGLASQMFYKQARKTNSCCQFM